MSSKYEANGFNFQQFINQNEFLFNCKKIKEKNFVINMRLMDSINAN